MNPEPSGIGISALARGPTVTLRPQRRRRPPFTSGARNALKAAVDHARDRSADVVAEPDLLYSILNLARPDPAAELIDVLEIDRIAALEGLEQRKD